MVLADSSLSFWNFFWLLLIYIPLLLVWGFALVDIFRRDDMSGWLKALWVVVVILLPFFGTLIYLLFRPAGATPQERRAIDDNSRAFVERYAPSNTTEQLRTLADLHDRGKLTDTEFATEKARVLGTASAPPAAAPSPGAAAPPAGAPHSATTPPPAPS
jgi:Phospholipase_D-nuclease N-terminal/Short C-terminal domain